MTCSAVLRSALGSDGNWFTPQAGYTATASQYGNPYMFTGRRYDDEIDMPDTGGPVCGMPSLAVRHSHPLHKVRQAAVLAGPEQKVPMVPHDAISAKTHRNTRKPFGKNTFKRRKIVGLFENAQTPIRTIHNMIYNIARIFTFATRHII